MTSQTRRRHIETARELARELRHASSQFEELTLRELDRREFWKAMQPDAELVERFRGFLEKLWFDGIRARFFAEFDASRLILPIASQIADRLDILVVELEIQAAGGDGDRAAIRHPLSGGLRMENGELRDRESCDSTSA